jgi:hypothetical protein
VQGQPESPPIINGTGAGTELTDPTAMEPFYTDFDPSEFDFLFTANAAFGS